MCHIQAPLPWAIVQAVLWNFYWRLIQPRVSPPMVNQSYDTHITVSWTRSGRSSLLFTQFSLVKFSSCKSWNLLDAFQAVKKTVPCQKANTTHPLLRYIPKTRNLSVAKVCHGQNHTSGPHWVIYHMYRWMLRKASQWPCSWFISCFSQSSLWKATPWWRLWIGHCCMSYHSSSWPIPPDASVAQGMLCLGRTK